MWALSSQLLALKARFRFNLQRDAVYPLLLDCVSSPGHGCSWLFGGGSGNLPGLWVQETGLPLIRLSCELNDLQDLHPKSKCYVCHH